MVTPEIVVDTSVAFKWFVAFGESGLGEAAQLLTAHQRGEVVLIAPSTLPVEIANTLRYIVAPEDARALLADFEAFHVDLVEITYDLVQKATSRAAQTGIGVYDALFLALAEEHDCPLATADRKAFADAATAIEIRLV